ncbi:MAG: class I SAM-dependent methyltransferase [Proteobacteria bacterium]|nr:class I SAM-dependent methyltransferase [Pseudomonadota bacterium]
MNAPYDVARALPLPHAARAILGDAPRPRGPAIPDYLRETYAWAYLDPRNVRLLDHDLVVATILWGNHRRLQRLAFEEFRPGERVLQAAAVYGDFSRRLALHLGPEGLLEVIDVAPIQAATARRKLRGLPQARVRRADARRPGDGVYDGVCCYFLLHEIPDPCKREVVNALLARVRPGGVAVFVDYHRPVALHPLKAVTGLVFDTLEPFAKSLWELEIADLVERPGGFAWRKRTIFGGLFQKVSARRAPFGV